jgi:hypothetical protein
LFACSSLHQFNMAGVNYVLRYTSLWLSAGLKQLKAGCNLWTQARDGNSGKYAAPGRTPAHS